MKTVLIAFGCLLSFVATAQPEPLAKNHRWLTTVDMGVQLGRVRPDQPNYYGGWGWYGAPTYIPQRSAGNRIGLTIHAFTGYPIRSWLIPGLATGVDYYNNSAFFPLAAAVQGNLSGTQRRISPYYSLESGYAFRGPNPHNDELSGGWLWSPGLGLRINKGNGTGFLVSAGYRHQQAQHNAPVDGIYILSQVENRRYNRIYFRMGFSF